MLLSALGTGPLSGGFQGIAKGETITLLVGIMAVVVGTLVSFVVGRVVHGAVAVRVRGRRNVSESGGLEQRLAEN